MEREIRIPQQKRSIDKKERIIEAAKRVFNQKGYFGTNTVEIAQEAGLSTGSIYAYFEDKKDILLACLNKFGNELINEICKEIGEFSGDGDLISTAKRSIKVLMKSHEGQTKLYHDEIESLQYRDEDVRQYHSRVRKSLMAAVTDAIAMHGYVFLHDREQIFLLFQLVEGIEDELTFDRSPDIDHDVLLDECAKIIVSMVRKRDS